MKILSASVFRPERGNDEPVCVQVAIDRGLKSRKLDFAHLSAYEAALLAEKLLHAANIVGYER